MKSLKILILSSVFLFGNCSVINDKIFSRSDKTPNDKPEEQEIVVKERVYIEDEKEEKIVQKKEVLQSDKEGLRGDTEYENNIEYPNLADVPERPDPSISLEEQDNIVKNLENNSQLQSFPSESVIENKVSNIENRTSNRKDGIKPYSDVSIKSIKDKQNAKLGQIENFKPDPSYSKDHKAAMNDEEKELHSLAKELKNIQTQEQISNVRDKINENDSYYNPQDIAKILGLKGLDSKEEIVKKTDISKKQNITKNKSIEKRFEEREVPVARITFNHGSSKLSDEDFSKIKQVVNLFNENKGKKIVIVGHASSRTNYDMDLTKHALVNFNISLDRARKVMSEFSTIGFDSQSIELVAMSDAKPLYSEIMPRLEAGNRRAEIFIQY